MFYKNLLACLVVASAVGIPSVGRASLNAATSMIDPLPRPAPDLTLTFSYEVDLKRSHFELTDESSATIPCADAEVSSGGTDVIVPIQAPLRPGSYTVKWRALSKDGRRDEGSYTFQVSP